MFDFKAFYLALSKEDQVRFAEAAGTSPAYVNLHLIRGRRVPRPQLMSRLVAACAEFGQAPSMAEFAAFFFQPCQPVSAEA